jgi:glucose/arabinose dehydrogenase
MCFIKTLFIFLLAFYSMSGLAQDAHHSDVLDKLHLPDGFRVSIFAENLPNARSLALGEKGVVYVGTGASGNIYAVEDSNNDGTTDKSYTIASNLYMPNGVAFKDGSLYVAEINRIIRFNQITDHLIKPPLPVVLYDKLPSNKHHGWKYLRFGPDGKLYSAIGAPCNICKPDQPYASLFRMNADGSQFEIIAEGIRNTVGFD